MRRTLPMLCLAFLLTGLTPRLCTAQPAPAQPAAASAQAQPVATPANPQAYSLPPDKLAKAIALSRIRNILDFAGSLWGLAFLWLLLATRAAASLAAWAQRLLRRRWLQGLLFFAAFLVISTLADLPLDAIGHHFGRSYGISVQGWGSWLGDQAKSLGLTLLLGAPLLLLFNLIVRRWPRRYWLGLWVVTLPLLVLGNFAAPLLAPIFNKFEPLSKSNPALVAELEKVVARTGTNIPPDRMFLMKASLKTNGLNAYVSGMGATKRVVVWDTTAGRVPNDEVLFIFGHESGHYVLNHIPKEIAGTALSLFFIYWGCAAFAGWLARRFGARWQLGGIETNQTKLGAPSIAAFAMGGNDEANNGEAGTNPLASRQGFLVLLFAISVVSFLMTPASNAFSRHFEHEADVYGQESIHGLVADPQTTTVSAFNHLGEATLVDPNPSPFIEFWSYSHPSVQHRAEFAQHYDPWANGGHGRFFDK